ncbi:alanine racemase, partial [bacterium]|nr:alanine racemase [bacterium]
MKSKNYRSWIEINTEQFKENIRIIRKSLDQKCEYLQLVKADGYGHGALEIAKLCENEGVSYFGVANAKEGAFLRDNGIKGNIIIVGPSFYEEIDIIIKKKLIPSISDIDFASALNEKSNHKISVHIEIDSGMGRGGILYYDALSHIKKISKLKNIRIEGIFSHFPNADSINKFSKKQIEIFKELIKDLENANIRFKFTHLANSGGFLYYPDSIFNMVRIGLLSFGYFPGENVERIRVKPIMEFYSRIALIKNYKPGAYISYGSTFKVKRGSKIGIIPLGYADGVFRSLSNKGEVIIKGQKFPIIGNISMDMFMVDITDSVEPIEKGELVTLIGCEKDNCIDANDWARPIGTINYEVLTSIGKRSMRIYKCKRKSRRQLSYSEKFFEKNFENKSVFQFLKSEYGIDFSADLKEQLNERYLKKLFGSSYDYFRDDFIYNVKLEPHNELYYKAQISISFKKWVNSSALKIGITNNNEKLEELMKDKGYIYR